MSTWHQDKAPVNPQHPFNWTVYSNPPNRSAGAMSYPTKAEAEAFMERLKANAAERPDDLERQLTLKHTSILPPVYTNEQRHELFYDVRKPSGQLGYVKKELIERFLLELCGGGMDAKQTASAMQYGAELRLNTRVVVKGHKIGPVGTV